MRLRQKDTKGLSLVASNKKNDRNSMGLHHKGDKFKSIHDFNH